MGEDGGAPGAGSGYGGPMPPQDGPTREWEGREAPAPGTWEVSPQGSRVGLVARYLRVARLRILFREFSGTIEVADHPEDTGLEATIVASSIDTGIGVLDRILQGPGLLHAERYPEVRFRSTEVRLMGESRLRLVGDLTIRDVTRPVTMQVDYLGLARDGRGRPRARFLAFAEIDRDEFLAWKHLLGIRHWLIGQRVRIELLIEALPPRVSRSGRRG